MYSSFTFPAIPATASLVLRTNRSSDAFSETYLQRIELLVLASPVTLTCRLSDAISETYLQRNELLVVVDVLRIVVDIIEIEFEIIGLVDDWFSAISSHFVA